ncbi:MAG: HPr family phosphocarrier protein [Candidatus Brocadiaceae bacterium]|nr:HPr family phosphocarrier protein [Candidatus Brocadiaceae bacterium]
MSENNEHCARVGIENPMGFHVRPVQRFAQLARMFRADVTVSVRGRTVPGTSVINLVSLGGRSGDTLTIKACGADARQCVAALKYLAQDGFFVEDYMQERLAADRHVERLHRLASCFDSEIRVRLDDRTADAKQAESLASLPLTPVSTPTFEIRGPDSEQAQAVLEDLVASCFYIEDRMAERGRKVT